MPEVRTVDDLHRAVRSISRHFCTDLVVIIGSQSILLDWPDAPELMRTSGEIDAYPGNIQQWEADHPDELASEEINAFFGQGSVFHESHGFYIDGVDETTAKFPEDWRDRAVSIQVEVDSNMVTVIAPSVEDLVVAKLHRLGEKDRAYIAMRHASRPINKDMVRVRLESCSPANEILQAAHTFLDTL